MSYKRALVTVSNKEGLVEAVQPLAESGTVIVSTGGTAQTLKKAGIFVVKVEEQTQFKEVMDGRVKTLHPRIFMPLLARKENKDDEAELKKDKLEHFDLVICNLYPFEEQVLKSKDDFMKWVDIGGPSLLRASAKNFEKITVFCDPKDYHLLGLQKPLSLEVRKYLAVKVFKHMSYYNSMIAQFLEKDVSETERLFSSYNEGQPHSLFSISGRRFQSLRYGENPDQKSTWFHLPFKSGLHDAEILNGKPLSFNNLLDLQSSIDTLREFDEPCFVGIKHTNPCGVALGDTLLESVTRGLKADPVSIFGGIVALNKNVTIEVAELFKDLFFECLIAPSYDSEALKFLSKKKNLRILKWPQLMNKYKGDLSVYKLDGGFLVQDKDEVHLQLDECEVDGKRPNHRVQKDLEMAWKVCAHLKSNAISLVADGQTLGLGMGQVNRVDAVAIAIDRMKKYHKDYNTKELVLASDGFFPFKDSIQFIAQAGIRWVIQPGGSVRDEEVIKEATRLKVNMVRTGVRHFKH